MKIYQKLLILSAIPLIAYLFMCFVYAKDNFEEQNTISNMSKNAKLFVAASDLIHELQRERGRTSIYLSGGPRIAVDERRKASDVKVPIFIESANTSSLTEQDKAKAPQIISKLESIRKQVDTNKNDKETVNVYTEIISHLIGIESTIGNAKTTRGFGKALTTIITLEAAKESAGRLRAFTSGILTANLPITENQLSRLIGLKASIDTNLGSQSLALGKDSKSFFLEAQKSPEWEMTNKVLNIIVSKYKDGNFDFDSNSFFNSISKVIDDLGKVREIEINYIQKKLNEIEEDISSALTRMFLTIAMVTIIVVLATYFLSKSILKPINEIINYAKNISQGNLSSELNSNFSQEMEALKLSLLDMVSRLKDKIAESEKSKSEAIKQTDKAFIAMKEAEDAKQKAIDAKAEGMNEAANKLEGTIEIITSASEELSAQIEQSTRGAEIQSTRVSETATAMEEMNSTVLEVASNASSASQTADQAKNKANSGAKVVTLVVESIDEVQKTAIELKSNMTTLGKQAEGIGQILNVISDIADQTNLLALNAAIEAARAGDAGRGFAVVADEVRKLAEKTMTATKEVGEAIRGIQDVARINTENVDHAVEKIESATKLANQSGVELQSIVSLVDLTTDQIRSIATAAEQQSATSEQINRSVDDVNRIASETAGAMRESSQAITELARQAIALKNLVEKMKSDS